MCEIDVSDNSPVAPVTTLVPVGGGTWRLACKLGVIYGFGRKGNPMRIKQADQQMAPIALSKVGACSMRGIKNLRYIAKRIPTGDSVNFEVTITDEARPDFLFQIILEPSVVVQLAWDGFAITSEVLGKLDTLLTIKPGKLKQTQPPVIVREKLPPAILYLPKHQLVGERHSSHRSLVLFNDGKNLYSKSDETLNQLFFQMYYKESAANSIPGANFLESTVLFKTFGHTLDGSVVVMLREKFNNWCLTIAVGKGKTLAFDDNHRTMSVIKL